MKVSIFGLGYVGVVNMACFSKLGHTVFGCDVKPHKVDQIKSGKSPVHEPQVDELLSAGIQEGRIKASTDAFEVLEGSDAVLICVGTPSSADGQVNLDFTVNTALDILKFIEAKKEKLTLIFRSTIPPGTIENHIAAVFQKLDSSLQPELIFVPEFLREGSAVNDFFHCSRVVIGTADGQESAKAKQLFGYGEIPLVFTTYRTAEFVKYVDNAFHALKIAFVNEIYQLGSKEGVDIKQANDIFTMDTHLNISSRYLRPGLPYGGSCLPKDLRALHYLSVKHEIDTPLLHGIASTNRSLQNQMLQRILAKRCKEVVLFGLTFKSGTDDVRESPMLNLLNQLIQHGIQVSVFDTDINLFSLRIDHPSVVKHVETSAEEAFREAKNIVVCKKGFEQYLPLVPAEAHVFNYFSLADFAIANTQERLF